MIAAGIMFITLCFYTVVRSHPIRVVAYLSKENHQLYGTSLFNYRFSQLYLYGYISMATFYLVSQWLAQSDNLLQACHTLCRSNYLVSTRGFAALCIYYRSTHS